MKTDVEVRATWDGRWFFVLKDGRRSQPEFNTPEEALEAAYDELGIGQEQGYSKTRYRWR